MADHLISDSALTLHSLMEIVDSGKTLSLHPETKQRVDKYRAYLEKKIATHPLPIYGINTGFGSLCDKEVPDDELDALQINLVRSHACGTGDEVPEHIVKLMLLLKAQSLSYGNSGIRTVVIEQICALYNKGIFPVVYEQGSLGASGDLAPLAHLALPLLGEGVVNYKGQKRNATDVLTECGLTPIKLKAKEGLALLNGTQFMLAYACQSLYDGWKYFRAANLIASTSLEAFNARIDPFRSQLHVIRPHEGQLKVAAEMFETSAGSAIMDATDKAVQDPYSFRCIPQVHGASFTGLKHVMNVVEVEMNSVTDNPNIFPDDDMVLSGGNFHGQHLALALDYLAIALAELASISERRTYLLVSGQRGLPPYLSQNPGTESGFMIPQYTAASVVSQNKQLCSPASVDSIVSSNGQEDHVSMGANAATKCLRVVNNLKTVLAIELMTATQALNFRGVEKASQKVSELHKEFRNTVPFLDADRVLHDDIKKSETFTESHFKFPLELFA